MSTLNSITTQLDSIKTDVVTCHSNLKTNLIDKGVEVLPTDKMSNLIDKVGSIATGKKWASGTGTVSSATNKFEYAGTTSTENMVYGVIPALDFEPSEIACLVKVSSSYEIFTCYSSIGGIWQEKSIRVSLINSGYNNSTSTWNLKDKTSIVGDGTFKIPFGTTGYYAGNKSFNWIAYE